MWRFQKREVEYDKLYKEWPVLTKIRQNFQTNYNPHRIVTVDGSMVKFKRSTLKQCMTKKSIKKGFKVWLFLKILICEQKGFNFFIEILMPKRVKRLSPKKCEVKNNTLQTITFTVKN